MTDELLRLHDLIQERTGLVLYRDEQTLPFAERIAGPLQRSGCTSYSEYYDRLHDAASNSEEWSDIISAFSRPASPFPRHEVSTRILSKVIIPRLLEEHRDGLRIWSAACSTGEEPLSIAMALSEAGWFDRVRIDIYASDANANSVDFARRGIYDERRVSVMSSSFREKYFTPTAEGWQADPALLEKIDWRVANLVDENEIAEMASSHVIFCRNVFIYFTHGATERTLHIFRKQMLPGGYLFTDQGEYYDSLIRLMGVFEGEILDGITIWKKPHHGTNPVSSFAG